MPFKRGQPNPKAFKKGQSGNPGGRPKGVSAYVREKCGENGELLTDTLLALVKNDTEFFSQHGLEIPNTRELLEAVSMLYDRGWGKSAQAVEHSGQIQLPVRVIHEYHTT